MLLLATGTTSLMHSVPRLVLEYWSQVAVDEGADEVEVDVEVAVDVAVEVPVEEAVTVVVVSSFAGRQE